jgi:LysR family transcriptional regulator, cyn operon transcriptional activator
MASRAELEPASYNVQEVREFDAGRRAIHDVEELERGALRIAFTPTFTTYLVEPLAHSSTLAIRGVDQHQRPGPGRDGGGAAANTLDVGVAFDDVRSEDVAAEPLHQERLCLIVAKGIPPVATRSCLPPSLQGMDLALLNTPSMRPHDNRPRPPTTSSSRRGLILKLVRPVGCRCPSTASARSPRSCRRSLRATLLAKTKSNLKSIRVELLRCDDRHLRLKR